MRNKPAAASHPWPRHRLAWLAVLSLPLFSACLARSDMFAGTYVPPFSADTTFGSGGTFTWPSTDVIAATWVPQGIDVQPDGRIVVATTAGSAANLDYGVLHLNDDGRVDASFGRGGLASVDLGTSQDVAESVRVQADGTIVVAGIDTPADGNFVGGVARLLNGGALDTSFANGIGWESVHMMAEKNIINAQVTLTDGSLRLCGQGRASSSVPWVMTVYGMSAGGVIDTTFGSSGVLTISFFNYDAFGACAPGGANSIIAYGNTFNGASHDFALAVVLPSGAFDASFDDGSTGLPGRATIDFNGREDEGRAIAVQADGKILAAGNSQGASGVDSALARLLPSGVLDSSFGSGGKVLLDLGGNDGFEAVVVLADGRIACGGYLTNSSGDTDFSMAVFATNGDLDKGVGAGGVFSFDVTPGWNDKISAMVLDQQGRLLLFGSTSQGTVANVVVMRLVL